MKIKKKIKKKSGSKAENLRNLEAKPIPLVSYEKKRLEGIWLHLIPDLLYNLAYQ